LSAINRETITPISFQAGFSHLPVFPAEEIRRSLVESLGKKTGLNHSFFKEDSFGSEKKTGPGETIRTSFFADRILLLHDFPSQLDTVKYFADLSREIALEAARCEKIPSFLQQLYIIRASARPLRTDDARVFIGESVIGLDGEKTALFNRPIQSVGLRFLFPPLQDTPWGFDLRIQSDAEDREILLLENQCQYADPLSVEQIEEGEIERRLGIAVKFLHENAVSFLEKHNQAGENF